MSDQLQGEGVGAQYLLPHTRGANLLAAAPSARCLRSSLLFGYSLVLTLIIFGAACTTGGLHPLDFTSAGLAVVQPELLDLESAAEKTSYDSMRNVLESPLPTEPVESGRGHRRSNCGDCGTTASCDD